VAVIGQGQNGLIASQVMRMMGAAQVLGIDPVAERRVASLRMGCTHACAPADAERTLATMTGTLRPVPTYVSKVAVVY
jgi:threonine dehydrogenase-like Zn-dependent dehydrogenase